MLIVPTYLVYILVPIFYIALPTILILTIKSNKTLRVASIVFLVIFLIALFLATTFDVYYTNTQVKVLFRFSGESMGKTIHWSVLPRGKRDFLINILMLIPLGAVICINTKKKIVNRLIWAFVFGVITGTAIETIQYLLPVARTIQLSDVLLNTLSVVLGATYYHFIDCVLKPHIDRN